MNKLLVGLTATVFTANVFAATQTSSASTSSVVAPTSSAATISVPVSTVAPAPKKITISYVAETAVGAEAANKANWDGSVSSLQHVGFAYDLGAGRKAQIRQYGYYNATDAKLTDEWSMGETVLRFTVNSEFKLGDLSVAGDSRIYIPGSEYVREVGQYQFRHDMAVKQSFGRPTLSYGVSARAYAYSGKSDGEIGMRMMPSVTLEYKANNVFSPYVTAYTDNRWYNNGTGRALLGPKAGKFGNPAANSDVFYTDIGTSISLNKNVSLDAYMETGKNLRKSDAYDLLDASTSSYEIDLSVSM